MPNFPTVYSANEAAKAVENDPWPFVSRGLNTIANLPSAVTNAYKFALISNGTSNRYTVQSDGTIWRYLDGTAA